MSSDIPDNISREKHSQESAKYVYKEWEDNTSVLKTELTTNDALSINDIYELCKIIQAHSDVKDKTVTYDENGLNNSGLSFNRYGINTLGLAAVLRLADELDVASDRLGNELLAQRLSSKNFEQQFSAKRWQDLHFCSNVCIQPDDISKLIYVCDDNYIQAMIEKKELSRAEITERILKIIDKINCELEMAHQRAFSNTHCEHFNFRCKKITPVSHILLLDKVNEFYRKDVLNNGLQIEQKDEHTQNNGRETVIWLPDAENAIGEQTRFESYSKVGAVKSFIPDKPTAQDPIWGISAIKGAGKTFLLQVKRVKVSNKYFTIPLVNKPSDDNMWATETISNVKNHHIFGSTIDELSSLWKYAIVCHVVLTYRYYLENTKTKSAKEKHEKLVEYIDSQISSGFTKNILTSVLNFSLDGIMTQIVEEANWKLIVANDYVYCKNCAAFAVNLLLESRNNRKLGFALFLDKVDQFIDPPAGEDPPEACDGCEYKKRVEECMIPIKSEEFCREKCKDMCCYTCPTFSDAYAGTKIRTASSSQSILFSHVNYWQYFQLSLINAAYNIKLDFNGAIKVFFTVREEALNCEDNILHDRKAKVFSIFSRIYYTKNEQKTIFYESIQNESNVKNLFDPSVKFEDPEISFIGVNSLCHPYVTDGRETVFDSIYRHSFDRARDIQHHGKALAEKVNLFKKISNPKEREEAVKKTIEDTAASLLIQGRGLPSYYEEKMDIMPRYWQDRQHFIDFIRKLDRNLMFSEDITKICKSINKRNHVNTCDGKGCNQNGCIHHPFSFLYKLGLLGIVRCNENNQGDAVQEFVDSNEITYFHETDELYTDCRSFYVLHPALTKAVESLKKSNIHHFKGFIIGKSLPVSRSYLKQLLEDKKRLSKFEFEKKYYS